MYTLSCIKKPRLTAANSTFKKAQRKVASARKACDKAATEAKAPKKGKKRKISDINDESFATKEAADLSDLTIPRLAERWNLSDRGLWTGLIPSMFPHFMFDQSIHRPVFGQGDVKTMARIERELTTRLHEKLTKRTHPALREEFVWDFCRHNMGLGVLMLVLSGLIDLQYISEHVKLYVYACVRCGCVLIYVCCLCTCMRVCVCVWKRVHVCCVYLWMNTYTPRKLVITSASYGKQKICLPPS